MKRALKKVANKKIPSHKRWNTADEVIYLKGIGTWMVTKSTAPMKVLLEEYLALMDIRADWGDIDPVFIRHWVTEKIETLSKEEAVT